MSAPAAAPISVMVVDDDYQVAEVHAAYVRKVPGFTVTAVAHSAREALAGIAESRPDLLLLDLYLPDQNGLELLRALRGRPDARPDVIVITAARDVASIRRAMQDGAVHYLVKPFGFTAIRDRLQSYCDMRQKMGRLQEASQADINSLYAMLRPSTEESLPKGLSTPTLQSVVEILRSAAEDVSAAELAECLGLARATAARYLMYLCEQNRAELRLRYGGPGRPEHRYRWPDG